MMKQKTARTMIEAITWIATHDHHKAWLEAKRGSTKTPPRYSHFVLENHHERLRVPIVMWHQMSYAGPIRIKVNRRRFDTRMYFPTAAGLKLANLRKMELV